MMSRKDYLDRKCTHREYYSQFVTDEIKGIVEHSIGIDALKASTDKHLNDIRLSKWDRLFMPSGTNAKLKEAGDYLTPAGKVCILKEAARQLLER